ncbi:MAG TPA: hypothetical protein VGQ12_12225 [Candidatus Angelobacter sp.]|jgi:hypothetical protein|nr:hypothetical protein [Candidatus Angelobacter sp.]
MLNWKKSAVGAVVLLSSALAPLSFAGDAGTDRGDLRPPPPVRQPVPLYKIQAGIDGEIYPVLANYASMQRQGDRTFGVVSVTLSNTSAEPMLRRVNVRIPGWSDEEIQTVEVAPGITRTVVFAPAFLSRLYQNHEIAAATAHVTITDTASNSSYETTVPVRLRSAEDMFWGNGFKYASFIASWVTPHDHIVESVLSRAKGFTADHRLPGYENWKTAAQQEQETYREAQAIFNTLQRIGLSYVKSSATLGDHKGVSERVRMPRMSLAQNSANCIDAAVMYASLFENLGMDASIVIVPGHAYAGVRVAEGSPKFLLIDVALTGRSTFEAAVASAQKGMASHAPSTVTQVMVEKARSSGIYPMP